MKKITLATVKSWIKKNHGNIYIQIKNDFCGYNDCVIANKEPTWELASHNQNVNDNTLGINGAWVVKQSRDSLNAYDDNQYQGFYIYNCTGSFYIGIKK